MKTALIFLFCLTIGPPIWAGSPEDRKAVEAFYKDLLNRPKTENLSERAAKILAPGWVAYPTLRGGSGPEGLVRTLSLFAEIVPDLTWTPLEILEIDDRYVVRGVCRGTPNQVFFGAEPSGKSFEIITIDIHRVIKGKIVESYHVEDWDTAIRQIQAG